MTLEEARNAEGLSRAEVAKRLEISERTVYRHERDGGAIKRFILRQYADLYRITPSELDEWDGRRIAA